MSRYTKVFFQLLISILLLGCSGSFNKLKTAGDLMETHPDSALHILQNIHSNHLIRPSDKALYALLLSQALDKNDIKVESDSLIRVATDYYKKNDPLHAGYAWFYMARCANNSGNAKTQADALLKAQGFAENARNDKLLGLVYGDEGDMYASQGEMDSFIVYKKLSYKVFKKANEKYNCVINLLNIGHAYLNAQQPDSAIAYYSLANDLSRSLTDITLHSTIYRSLAMGFYKKRKYKMALYYLNSAPITHVAIYDYNNSYLKAMVYLDMDKFDSVYLYLNKVKKPAEMAPDYYHLWQTVYEKKGDFKKALYFANKTMEAKDTLSKRNLEISFSGLDKKYKYQSLQVSNQELIIKNAENKMLLLIGIIVFGILLLITILWRYNVNKKELIVQKQLVDREKENNQLLDNQIKTQSIMLSYVEQYRKQSIKRPIDYEKKQPVFSSAQNLTFHEEIIVSMDVQYHDISKRLYQRFPKLTERDVLICCLLLAGFESGMVATILDVKIESLIKQRYRLRSKLEIQKSDNLIDYLRNF